MSKTRHHQRDHESNQQVGVATRPQLPRDGSPGMVRWKAGELPSGGFRSVFDMSGMATPTTEPLNTKLSPTSGGGKKVY